MGDVEKAAMVGTKDGHTDVQNASTNTGGMESDESTNSTEQFQDASKSQDKQKTNLETSSDSLSYLLNSCELKSSKSSRKSQSSLRSSSQLGINITSSSITAESAKNDESGHSETSSRQGDSQKSITSTATSKERGTAGIHSAFESSTRIHSTGDTTSFKRPAADWFSYMTRGFKFSYFQYYSK